MKKPTLNKAIVRAMGTHARNLSSDHRRVKRMLRVCMVDLKAPTTPKATYQRRNVDKAARKVIRAWCAGNLL